jgi:hypothetical protein
VNIRSVWATTATRETFSTAERYECVEDCAEHGPDFLPAPARVEYAFYRYPNGPSWP